MYLIVLKKKFFFPHLKPIPLIYNFKNNLFWYGKYFLLMFKRYFFVQKKKKKKKKKPGTGSLDFWITEYHIQKLQK